MQKREPVPVQAHRRNTQQSEHRATDTKQNVNTALN